VIAWFTGTTEGRVESELIYKNGASAPHRPPFSPEKVADWVGSMAEMWAASQGAAEIGLFDLVDLSDVDWKRVGTAIRDWYRGPGRDRTVIARWHTRRCC
jgi:hypothetical protein